MQKTIATLLALVLAALPLRALAQGMDPTTRALVAAAAAEVAYGAVPGAPRPSTLAFDPTGLDTPDTPSPDAVTPREPDIVAPLDLSDRQTAESEGLTIQAPAAWEVASDMGPEMPFFIEVPGADLMIFVEANTSDFPGLAGIAIFAALAEGIADSFGEDVEMVEAAAGFTEQEIPTYYFVFAGESEGEMMGGMFYVFAPGPMAYLLLAVGSLEDWEANRPGVDLIANSLQFDEELILLEKAGDEAITFVSSDGTTSVVAPPGWYASDSDDAELPVIVGAPDMAYVAAIGTEASFGEELRPEIAELFVPSEGESNPEDYDDLVGAIVEMLGSSGQEVTLDPSRQAVYPRDGAVTIRLVGTMELDTDLPFTVATFVDLRESGGAVMIVFGDIDRALDDEEALLTILESIRLLE